MGTRQQKFRCLDCKEDVDDDLNYFERDAEITFWVDMEHMNKEELLQHISEIECPSCGSDNWFMTDASQI